MISIILLIVGLCIAVLAVAIIISWKLMTKAGEEGWKCLIPYYGSWIMHQIIGLSPYWVIVMAILSVLERVIGGSIINIIQTIIIWYWYVIYMISIAKSYGKDTGFGVLGIFFPIITFPILASNGCKYVGPHPMNDPVMKFVLNTLNIKDDGTGRNKQQPVNGTYNMNSNSNMNMYDMNNMNQSTNNNVNNMNMNDSNMSNNTMNMGNNNMNQTSSKFCPNCGSQVQDGDSFCLGCGSKLC